MKHGGRQFINNLNMSHTRRVNDGLQTYPSFQEQRASKDRGAVLNYRQRAQFLSPP